jgi:hypothetical protein
MQENWQQILGAEDSFKQVFPHHQSFFYSPTCSLQTVFDMRACAMSMCRHNPVHSAPFTCYETSQCLPVLSHCLQSAAQVHDLGGTADH